MARKQLVLLPGILMPAALRYGPLLAALGDGVQALPKDLEVYAGLEPPHDYSIGTEVEGVARAADAAGFKRFHLYGHSGGGAVAIAFAITYPERILSLALDEPAFDFTQDEKDARPWQELDAINTLPPAERITAFLRLQLRPGVELPPRPSGPPPPWMANRPAGIEAFTAAARTHLISDNRFAAMRAPVYYSYGDLSNEEWERRRDRLGQRFTDFTSELYVGCHHLNTSHTAQPARVAGALYQLWARSKMGVGSQD
jgi:pimeloyl-ACP methyl ester carboxylesterase